MSKWITVELPNARIERHPNVKTVDVESDLVLHLASGDHVTYRSTMWRRWWVTQPDELSALREPQS